MHEPEPPPAMNCTAQRVTVVVLNWNGWRDTLACLESLRHLAEVPRVIVVDNGSSDESVERLRASAPWVRLVTLDFEPWLWWWDERGDLLVSAG